MSSHHRSSLPTLNETLSAAGSIAQSVTSTRYALCGGAGCVVLGSQRQTEDVDFVVPKGDTAKARSDLRNSQAFTVQPKTNHTAFVGPHKNVEAIDVEILTPPMLFKYNYTGADNEVEVVNGVRVLSPYIILESKVGAIFSRSSDQKRKTDAGDIMFLVNYLHSKGRHISVGQAGLSKEFIDAFLQQFPNAEEIFKRAGLVQKSGSNTPTAHTGLGSRPGTPTGQAGSRPGTPTSRPGTPISRTGTPTTGRRR